MECYEDLPVSITLLHSGVDEETRIPKLGDLSRQQLDSLCAVAEDYRLRDVQL